MVDLINMLKLQDILDLEDIEVPKSPIIMGVILAYISTVFLQNADTMSLRSTIWFTVAMVIHLFLHLFYYTIFKHRYWIYFIIQGIIVFNCAIIMPNGFQIIFLGLIPILIFQSMIVYNDAKKIIITSIFFYSIFCGTIIMFVSVEELIRNIPIFLIITVTIISYAVIFLEQVKLRIRTQKILQELELAYEKVEELTLMNERQRMARDLHDTLSQGIVGLMMQLDAVNANLNNNNIERAQGIIQRAMEHARKTLGDSRLVIDDLRLEEKTEIDFVNAIENEIVQFKSVSNISIMKDIKVESQVPSRILKHIIYIVREALNNIAKHAKAKKATIKLIETQNQINIDIADNGIGFNLKLLDQQSGHYGILGMTERVKAINGKIKIESKKKYGTNLNITIPIPREKGIYRK